MSGFKLSTPQLRPGVIGCRAHVTPGGADRRNSALAALLIVTQDHRDAMTVDTVRSTREHPGGDLVFALGHSPSAQDRFLLCAVIGI
jgi:hypothetical protein